MHCILHVSCPLVLGGCTHDMRLPELHTVLEIPVLQVTATARAGVSAVAPVAMTTSRCAHVRYMHCTQPVLLFCMPLCKVM